ncbi:unnamed protein product [Brachionus calyciflorus]|uniref:Uncharacterized protein n=1 Tax=Brachionus calyciflorus TaxID=104777 RepID=A0A814D433_9BILA|nr:unnamed protein product [Brachionus calyciflorus]
MPDVPCMLLTATATPRVRNDILMQMKLRISEESSYTSENQNRIENKLSTRVYLPLIPCSNQLPPNNQNCVFFMQSFIRENLQYKVEYKTILTGGNPICHIPIDSAHRDRQK